MLVHSLHRLGQLADAPFVNAKLSARQYAALTVIRDAAGNGRIVIQKDVIDATGIDRSTASDIIKRLERQGFVTRQRGKSASGDRDDRCIVVTMTAAGSEYIARAEKIAAAAEKALLDRIAPSRRPAFLKAIADIIGDGA